MREIRTSGSVRGEGGNPLAYSTAPSHPSERGAEPAGTGRMPVILMGETHSTAPNEANRVRLEDGGGSASKIVSRGRLTYTFHPVSRGRPTYTFRPTVAFWGPRIQTATKQTANGPPGAIWRSSDPGWRP